MICMGVGADPDASGTVCPTVFLLFREDERVQFGHHAAEGRRGVWKGGMGLDGSVESRELAALGKRIRDRRLVLQLSQEEVAERAGISAYTVGRIESGRMAMSVGTFKKLAQALGVDAGVLLGVDVPDAGEGRCTDVFQLIRHLGRREQETVLQTLEKLLDRLGRGM